MTAFTVDYRELKDAYGVLKRAIPRHGGRAVLQGVRCQVVGDDLTLTTTRCDETVRVRVACLNGFDGTFVVPSRAVLDAVKAADRTAPLVTFTNTDDGVDIEAGGVSLRVPALPADEFPRDIDVEGDVVEVPWSTVADVLPAVGTDQARPILTGVLFETDGSIVACDSYRLHIGDGGPAVNMLVPATALQTVAQVLKAKRWAAADVSATVGARDVRFTVADVEVTVRLIEGGFPNWRPLVPRPDTAVFGAVVDTADTAQAALKMLAAFTKKEGSRVRLTADGGKVRAHAHVRDVGEQSVLLDGWSTWGVWPEGVNFNPAYLLSCTAGFAGRLECVDLQKPAVCRPADPAGVVRMLMPVKA